MDKIIKVGLALLLIGCLADMHYGYYQFVRFAGMAGFLMLAYSSNDNNKKSEIVIYIGLALLFQPFIKVALGRHLWNIVDVIIAVGLLISLANDFKKKDL
jgi:hypothetical protein